MMQSGGINHYWVIRRMKIMTKEEWLATQGTLNTILEYAKASGNNDIYNAVMMLKTYLMKDKGNNNG
jgi:phosphoserine aminotransferase